MWETDFITKRRADYEALQRNSLRSRNEPEKTAIVTSLLTTGWRQCKYEQTGIVLEPKISYNKISMAGTLANKWNRMQQEWNHSHCSKNIKKKTYLEYVYRRSKIGMWDRDIEIESLSVSIPSAHSNLLPYGRSNWHRNSTFKLRPKGGR